MNRITLSIGAIPDLIIRPNNKSTRSPIRWITRGDATATGTATVKGITARKGLYIYNIYSHLFEWEYLRLERIDGTQQDLFAADPINAAINLKDEFQRINSLDYNKNGRTVIAGSARTENGETSYYANFKVTIEIPKDTVRQLNPWLGSYSKQEVNFIAEEL